MFLHVAASASYDHSDDGVARRREGERVSMMHGVVSSVSRIEGEEHDAPRDGLQQTEHAAALCFLKVA